jgi:hypothetical protein
LPAPRRIDPEAYRAYLAGKRQLELRTTDSAEAAISFFKRTVSLAPDFADGFAELADADIVLADKMPDRVDLIPAAEAALTSALRLDPTNVDALSARLELSLHKLDWPGAIRYARKLQETAPNSAKVLHEMFRFFDYMAFPDLAFAAARGAARLDPLSLIDRLNMATFLLHDARFPEAVEAGKAALGLGPHHPFALAILCVAAANAGQRALASTTGQELSRLAVKEGIHSADDTAYPLCAFAIAAAEHRAGDAEKIVDGLANGFPQSGISAFELGEKYAIAGDFNKADVWFARSYDNRESLLFFLPSDKIVPATFRDSAEYKTLLDRPLFREWGRAHDALASDLAAR